MKLFLLQRTSPMKPIFLFLLVVTVATSAAAQNAASQSSFGPGSSGRAAVEGLVTREPGSEPIKKALIELIAEDQTQAGDYTAVTGADGLFRIENVLPGRYHLFAERTGLLDAQRNRGHADGQILTLAAGQELKDLHIRLQAAAVVRGRVTDEDGDPLPNAEVSVMRQTFVAGHHRWEQLGGERTNDLGEFRVPNLAPGTVYVSVTPPPDFRSMIESGGIGADTHVIDKAPSMSYQTTYYPDTLDRSQASPVSLHAGDEFPVNFTLVPNPTSTIRGSVSNIPAHATAGIMLQSHDFALVLNGAEMHKDGTFIIRDVAPGSYTIVANVEGAAVPMMARQSLQISAGSVDDVRLSPQPGTTVRGRVRFENRPGSRMGGVPEMFLILTSADGDDEGLAFSSFGASNVTHVGADGSFEFKDIPPGDYYLRVGSNGMAAGASEDWFVRAVNVGGRDVSDSGLNVSGGQVLIDLVVSNNGGVVDGVVVDAKGNPLPNADVVAVPEARLRSHVDRYGKTTTDQSGHFTLRGLRPGDYTVIAWDAVDGEAYYNPDFVKMYESQGSTMRLGEGDRRTLQLQAIPSGPDAQAEQPQP